MYCVLTRVHILTFFSIAEEPNELTDVQVQAAAEPGKARKNRTNRVQLRRQKIPLRENPTPETPAPDSPAPDTP